MLLIINNNNEKCYVSWTLWLVVIGGSEDEREETLRNELTSTLFCVIFGSLLPLIGGLAEVGEPTSGCFLAVRILSMVGTATSKLLLPAGPAVAVARSSGGDCS